MILCFAHLKRRVLPLGGISQSTQTNIAGDPRCEAGDQGGRQEGRGTGD